MKNHNPIGRFIYFLACLPLFFVITVLHAEQLTCHAEKNGVLHKLSIEKTASEIKKLSYRSQTTNAAQSMCEIFIDRSDPSGKSTWEYSEKSNLHVINILSPANDDKAKEVVIVSETPTIIHVRLLNSSEAQVHNLECGLNGYLSPQINLRKNKGICEFN